MKKVTAVILAFCMIFSFMPNSSAAERPANSGSAYAQWKASLADGSDDPDSAVLASDSYVYINNEYLGVSASYDGRYTIGKVNSDNAGDRYSDTLLLYGHPNPGTSNTMIRISKDNGESYNDYWFTANRVRKNGDAIEAVGVFDGVEVTETLQLEKNYNTGKDDVVGIHYDYVNNNDVPVQVGVRIQMDTMLGENDGAPFRVAGDDVTTEREYAGREIPQYWQAFDSLTDASVISTGTFYFDVSERPDKVQFAYWGDIVNSEWDYKVTENKPVTWDSAVAVYFNPRFVPALGSGSVVTYYGLAEIIPNTFGELKADVSAPASLYVADNGGYYNNNPFTVTAYLSNIGNGTLNNVTARLTASDGLVLESESEQNVGNITTSSDDIHTVYWTVRATPQTGSEGGSRDAEYTLSFYADGEQLGESETKTISLPYMSEAKAYRTVRFASDGNEVSSVRVPFGTSVEKPADPVKEGSAFGGWYANPECFGASWFDSNGDSLPVTSNLTLYAGWSAGGYTDYKHIVTYTSEVADADDVIFLVKDGDVIADDAIPAVPEKAADESAPNGYEGYWDRNLSGVAIAQDTTVNAKYDPIEDIPVRSVELSIHSLTLDSAHDSYKLEASVSPANATDQSLTWESSDTNVVTVDQDGLVTRVGTGTANVTVTSGSNKEAKDTCAVIVNGITKVEIGEIGDIEVGASKTPTVTVEPEGAETDLVWSIQNTDIASINSSTGEITGIAPGTTVVMVSTADGSQSDAKAVNVISPSVLTGIRLEGTKDVSVISGEPLSVPDLKVYALYSDNTEGIEVSDYTLSSYTPITANDLDKDMANADEPYQMQNLTVSYTERGETKTADFSIKVIPLKYPVGIVISKRPFKRVYNQGESLDLTNLEITAMYNCGKNDVFYIRSNDDLNTYGLTVSGYNSNLIGTQDIVIAYGNNLGWDGSPNTTTLAVKVIGDASSGNVIVQNKVLMPQMSIESFHEGKKVTLSAKVDSDSEITNETAESSSRMEMPLGNAAEIWYTLDGSIPAKNSGSSIACEKDPFDGTKWKPIELRSSATVKAVAYDDKGNSSLIASGRVSVPKVDRPTANYESGQLEAGSIVKFDCGTPGAEIRYQLVDSDGKFEENSFREGNSIMVDNSTKIYVIAYKDGYSVSNTLVLNYNVPSVARGKNATFALGNVTSMSGEKASVSLGVFMEKDTKLSSFHTRLSYRRDFFDYEALAGIENAATTRFRVDYSEGENEAGVPIGILDIYYDGDANDENTLLDSGEVASITFLVNDKAVDGKHDLTFNEQNVAIQTTSLYNNALTTAFNNGFITLIGCENSQLTGEVAIVDKNGDDVKSGDQLNGGDNITATINFDQDSVSVVNEQGQLEELVTVNVWMAVYGRRGMLLNVQSWDMNLSDMDNLMYMQTLQIPEGLKDIGSVRLMITSERMAPLMISTAFG